MRKALPAVLLVLTLLLGAAHAEKAEEGDNITSSPAFTEGVKAYRDGDYIQARRTFYGLHKEHPENLKITYYLAITEGQLGRFQNAKKLYEEIVSLDPNGEAANYAREGLKYLPSNGSLDLPPRFQGQANATATSQPSAIQQPTAQNPTAMGSPSGLSQQDWMAWQTLMGQTGMGGNQNNNNGMNGMMPWMNMMPSTGGNPANPSGMGGYDPNAMSTMLMNQMMQNFSMGDNKDDNR